MKRRSFAVYFVLTIVMAITAAANVRPWLRRIELRAAVDVARARGAELSQLQAEHQRLREKQIPAADLDALRADHQALLRLRAELEALTRPAVSPR